jgi:acetylornithine/N-succinyldiaminopimelate aminotransferase
MAAAESPLLPVYAPPEQIFVRGEGCWIWDDKGEKYLDCIAGIAVNALGHAPPVLQKALTEQAAKLWHTSNMFKVKGQFDLAEK